ncbi:dTDP-4-dehydrorhamnose reductase [compost metagenome]
MELVRAAAARGMPVRIGPCDIAAVSTAAYGSVAQRPANSRLDTTRLTGTFALHMPDWQYGVAHLLDQITMVSK